jgi:YHS domain-containing protein
VIPPLFADAVPASPAELPADSVAGEPADTVSPFTEMSEAEADKKLELNPFTGLVLDENAGSANAPTTSETKPAANEAKEADSNSAPIVDPEDPFAEELKKIGLVPPGAEPPAAEPATTPKLEAPGSQSPTFDGIEDQATREKMKKIHERGSMKGLKGFCPVTLRDQRELVDAKPDFHSTFRGQKFHFANAEAKLKFDEAPAQYAPAAYGADVVALTRDKDVVEGSLDFAAWFKGRLYLFGTADAHDTFVADPTKYATPVGIE